MKQFQNSLLRSINVFMFTENDIKFKLLHAVRPVSSRELIVPEGLCYNSQLSTRVDPFLHGVLGVIGVSGVADFAHNDLRILKIPRNMAMVSFPEEF